MTLDAPYEGTGGSGKGWHIGDIIGVTTQPFQHGLAASQFYLVHAATGRAGAKTIADKLIDWVATTGYDAANASLRYQGPGPACSAPYVAANQRVCTYDPASANPHGWGDGAYVSSEVFRACSWRRINGGAPTTVVDNCEAMVARTFGGPLGGPGSDATKRAFELEETTAPGATKMKNLGFPYGVGGASSWPAARVGGYVPDLRTAVIAAGAGVTVRIRQPDGSLVDAVCTDGACPVTYDAAQGPPQTCITRGAIVGGCQ
jgi:hypothetical protein